MIKIYDPFTPEMKQQIVNDYCNSISLSRLIGGMRENGEYEHLMFIFKNNPKEIAFGKDEFLLVSSEGYRKVVLNDLNYQNNKLYMEIRDCKTGRIEKTVIDINNKDFKFILISWEDILQLIFSDCHSALMSEDLLELDE